MSVNASTELCSVHTYINQHYAHRVNIDLIMLSQPVDVIIFKKGNLFPSFLTGFIFLGPVLQMGAAHFCVVSITLLEKHAI